MTNANKTLSLSIMSGKGGVGKSNLALNIGYALHQSDQSVMLMDCDLGLANLDVLLGLTPEHTLQDILQQGLDSSDVLLPVEELGFDILPAASGVPELVEMDEDMREALFAKLVDIVGVYDYLILDLGAGISNTVLSFAGLSQLRIVIVTPEPTSMTDSYAVMKVLATRRGVRNFCVVVNQAESAKEAKITFERLATACKNFLNIDLVNLGYIRHDPKLVEAVRHQKPLLTHAPDAPAAQDIRELARKIRRYREENLEAIGRRPALKEIRDLKDEDNT